MIHVIFNANVFHSTELHVLKNDEELLVEVEDVNVSNQFIALQVGNYACFLDSHVHVVFRDLSDKLHREDFVITYAFDFENLSEASLVNLKQLLVFHFRIALFEIERIG